MNDPAVNGTILILIGVCIGAGAVCFAWFMHIWDHGTVHQQDDGETVNHE